MEIIKYRKIYFSISAIFVGLSILFLALYGLKLGIDFTGGSLMEISVFEGVETSASEIESFLITKQEDYSPVIDSVKVQPTDENKFILRFKNVTEDEHQSIIGKLNAELAERLPKDESSDKQEEPQITGIKGVDAQGNEVDLDLESFGSPVVTIGGAEAVSELRFESIGPVIGKELKEKTFSAILFVLGAIVLYIAWAFRGVSKPVASWKYGIIATIALAHDVIIPTGVFVVLGKVYGVEVDILFVTALLTILGYSVNDTIVVFDKTRENLSRDHRKHDFDWIVNKSVNETMRRSLFTSLTTFLVLLAVYIFGGDSIKNFILALMIGVVVGTYSSIFLASPLLVFWDRLSKR